MATGEFYRKENLRPITTSPLSKDLEDQMKHEQKTITIVDRLKNNIIATIERHHFDKSDVTYVQFRFFMRKNEAENIQRLVFVKYGLDEFLSLIDVIKSVSERTLLNQSICKNV